MRVMRLGSAPPLPHPEGAQRPKDLLRHTRTIPGKILRPRCAQAQYDKGAQPETPHPLGLAVDQLPG